MCLNGNLVTHWSWCLCYCKDRQTAQRQLRSELGEAHERKKTAMNRKAIAKPLSKELRMVYVPGLVPLLLHLLKASKSQCYDMIWLQEQTNGGALQPVKVEEGVCLRSWCLICC